MAPSFPTRRSSDLFAVRNRLQIFPDFKLERGAARVQRQIELRLTTREMFAKPAHPVRELRRLRDRHCVDTRRRVFALQRGKQRRFSIAELQKTDAPVGRTDQRSEEHTSELQSL